MRADALDDLPEPVGAWLLGWVALPALGALIRILLILALVALVLQLLGYGHRHTV